MVKPVLQILDWSRLDQRERNAALDRPALKDSAARSDTVAEIVRAVRDGGDGALREFTRRFDGVVQAAFAIAPEEFERGVHAVPPETRDAIDLAFRNSVRFHAPSGIARYTVETAAGVTCRREVRALGRVGLYIPGGSAPLPSTVLMLGVPAMLAGCKDVVLCTPPGPSGNIAPEILYAAGRCGIRKIFRVGGAQAIAAMAYGTETIPRVDRIFGPGNAWVTEAKSQVARDPKGAPVDMPAGPSELLIIADGNAEPAFIAADLLSQAEHGADSQVLLVSTFRELVDSVNATLSIQLAELPRSAVAAQALENSRAILASDVATAIDISNAYAPEHLILNVTDAESLVPRVRNAGSVFLGQWTPESLGDYVSGTNHVLPTYGYARQLGGLDVSDFQKSITVQSASRQGVATLGPAAIVLARAEGLDAHARAVSIRLESQAGERWENRRERA